MWWLPASNQHYLRHSTAVFAGDRLVGKAGQVE
jgi:hypothetical protein